MVMIFYYAIFRIYIKLNTAIYIDNLKCNTVQEKKPAVSKLTSRCVQRNASASDGESFQL